MNRLLAEATHGIDTVHADVGPELWMIVTTGIAIFGFAVFLGWAVTRAANTTWKQNRRRHAGATMRDNLDPFTPPGDDARV